MLANTLAPQNLCALELPPIEAMFQWEKGPNPGGPAPFWYAKVHDGSGFGLPDIQEALTRRYLELEQQAPYARNSGSNG